MSALDHHFPLPRDRSVGIGCIGSGFIMAECHLTAYRAVGFNPVAIASRTPAKARQTAERHGIATVYDSYLQMLGDDRIEVIDIAVPPDALLDIIQDIVQHNERGGGHLRALLVQKPLGMDYLQAKQIVELCRRAELILAVNQNMRYDQSIRACKDALQRGYLGEPVLATIDMRAVPHWMPWQKRLGWLTLRIMSIHHLDTFRYWFGDPERVYASVRPDPRTAERFEHEDGICLYILEYASGLRAMSCDDVWAGPLREDAEPDIGIQWRIDGTDGIARGTIGWPRFPQRTPSTIDFTTSQSPGWHKPRWDEVWFPDAFAGPMGELLCALEENRPPCISGADNLPTMALVDACYLSARTHRAVSPAEITGESAVRQAPDHTPPSWHVGRNRDNKTASGRPHTSTE
jgi:predicted dehydrogenase